MHKQLCLIAGLLSWSVPAAQQATVRQPTPLLQTPAADARQLAELAGSERLDILQRQGGWYQVAPQQKPHGWVRLFAVQFDKSLYQPDNLPLKDIRQLVRPGHNQVTSTTGVRGLDKVAIETAKPDFRALQQMQAWQQDPAALTEFVRSGQLHVAKAPPTEEKSQ